MSNSEPNFGEQSGGNIIPVGGGRRKYSRGHKRVKHSHRHGRRGIRGGGGFASDAGSWVPGGVNPLSPPEGMGVTTLEGLKLPGAFNGVPGGGQMGGHRCPSRHRRSKRTRKAHAGRKSRKNKSRGKKHGMSLRSIFGRS